MGGLSSLHIARVIKIGYVSHKLFGKDVAEVTSMLSHKSVNIVVMKLYRANRSGDVVMIWS